LKRAETAAVAKSRERGREISGEEAADRWVPSGSEREREGRVYRFGSDWVGEAEKLAGPDLLPEALF
jgi:hypothetical protein